MTTPSGLIVPSRKYQVVVFVELAEDGRSTAETQVEILRQLSPNLDFASKIRGVVVQQITAFPGVPTQ